MLLGLDSTDSLTGGCTTHTALQVWKTLPEFDVVGAPRLVRLNPNIPFKTRGNGALCLELGHGRGRRRLAALVDGVELWAAESIDEPTPAEARRIFAEACRLVDEQRQRDSSSGLVAFQGSAPPEEFYQACVKTLVTTESARASHARAMQRCWGDGQGLVGATAAAAWRAGRGTYELITYRHPEKWGTPRSIDPALGPALDEHHPTTFDNWDPVHEHLRVMPSSPCPVLAGIRGTDPWDLLAASRRIGPESVQSWALFATNQATGDHLQPRSIADIQPYESVILDGTVADHATTHLGGHVTVRLRDEGGEVAAWAFEPSKEFRDSVRALRAGDQVTVEGAVHADATVLALEALTVRAGARPGTLRPPACTNCGLGTKSQGRRGGYRCAHCGQRVSAGSVVEGMVRPVGNRVTVPILARRHLSRPNGLDDRRLTLSW